MKKLTAASLKARASSLKKNGPVSWVQSLPAETRKAIDECLRDGVGPVLLARALREEGYKDATSAKIQHYKHDRLT